MESEYASIVVNDPNPDPDDRICNTHVRKTLPNKCNCRHLNDNSNTSTQAEATRNFQNHKDEITTNVSATSTTTAR